MGRRGRRGYGEGGNVAFLAVIIGTFLYTARVNVDGTTRGLNFVEPPIASLNPCFEFQERERGARRARSLMSMQVYSRVSVSFGRAV